MSNEIPDTMRQLRIIAPGETTWEVAPTPRPAAGEVLVKVTGISSCPHWDLHILGGEPMFPGQQLDYPYFPGKPGHEAVGIVVARGDGVTDLSVGQTVVAWRDAGTNRPGFYAQFNAFPAEYLLPVPTELPAAQLASLELAMCVEVSFQRLAMLGGVKGKRVGIAGLGPAGLVALQLARYHGAAEVVGIDRVASRRELALNVGASETVDSDEGLWAANRGNDQALDMAI
ncbi:alcohol dehydrogenase catalytic domain-containing protein, partial [Synoicihabitans lomoniglobus]|nr:alcohol dehydrogenase catalytic domain-containing protein [Opitutaceae bacterium LMO-M01]